MCIMVISGPNFRPYLELQRGLGSPLKVFQEQHLLLLLSLKTQP